ncbi:hypothetical protein ACF0H5_012605 [Mactra antiquata]
MFNYQGEFCAKVVSTWHGLNKTVDVLTDGLGTVKNHLYTTAGVMHGYIPAYITQSKFLADLRKEWNMYYKEAYSWIHPKLMELSNTTLHYGSGVSIGILASVLIFFFIISRLLPSRLKSIGYILMLFGTSASMLILQSVSGLFQEPLSEKFIENWQYFAGYLAVSGLISFAVVYRYGPITDERTLNLVQWFLQGVGLIIVYNSTQIREVSIAIVLVLLGIYHFPTRLFWNQSTQNLWHRFFPPKIKLLTEDEYNKQGDIETRKELEKLREYCQSPDCKAWKVISKLKSPHRFAEFIIQGAWHISYEEMTSYDNQFDETTTVSDNDDVDSELVFVLGSVSRTVRA